jgi:hypothetical protein
MFTREPAIALAERDWVVIGDLVNMRRDDTFDGTLAVAFRSGIEQSRFVRLRYGSRPA